MLNASNYTTWLRSVTLLIHSHSLGPYLNYMGPNTNDAKEKSSDDPKKTLDMQKTRALILQTITTEIMNSVYKFNYPGEIMVFLKKRFATQRIDADYLYQKFVSLKFPQNKSMNTYINDLNNLVDQLAELDQAPAESLKIMVLLRELPSQYSSIKDALRVQKSLKFEQMCEILLGKECELQNESKISANVIFKPLGNKYNRPVPNSYICNICKGRGHLPSTCGSNKKNKWDGNNISINDGNASNNGGNYNNSNINNGNFNNNNINKNNNYNKGKVYNNNYRGNYKGRNFDPNYKYNNQNKNNNTNKYNNSGYNNSSNQQRSVVNYAQFESDQFEVNLVRMNREIQNLPSYEESSNRVLKITVDHETEISDPNEFVIDSGATNHIINYGGYFKNYKTSNKYVMTANHQKIDIVGTGNVDVWSYPDGNAIKVTLKDVLHCPDIKRNLLSAMKFDNEGYSVMLENGVARIIHRNSNRTIMKGGCPSDNLYRVKLYPDDQDIDPIKASNIKSEQLFLDYEATLPVVNANDYRIEPADKRSYMWHNRLGHLNFQQMAQMGFSKPRNTNKCRTCKLAKPVRKKFPRIPGKHSKNFLELIHSDICGPFKDEDLDGNVYFATFIDDFSRFACVALMKHKSQLYDELVNYINHQENYHYPLRVKELRCDNGGEYTSQKIINYLNYKGIRHGLTTVYSPQSNGIAERYNRILNDKVRALLIWAQLTNAFWGDALRTANYLKNRSISQKLNRTPFKLYKGIAEHDPEIDIYRHLRTFGCLATVRIPLEVLPGKHEPRAKEVIFIGYDEGSARIYYVYDPFSRKVIRSKDVDFQEDIPAGAFFNIGVSPLVISMPRTPLPQLLTKGIDGTDKYIEVPFENISESSEIPQSLNQDKIEEDTHQIHEGKKDTSKISNDSNMNSDLPFLPPESIQQQQRWDIRKRSNITTQSRIPTMAKKKDITDTQIGKSAKESVKPRSKSNITTQSKIPTIAKRKEITDTQIEQSTGESIEPKKRAPYVKKPTYEPKEVITQRGRKTVPKKIYDAVLGISLYDDDLTSQEIIGCTNITFTAAMKGNDKDNWTTAINREYNALIDKNTFTLVDRPCNAEVIPVHWILTNKFDKEGNIIKYKARLVAQGNRQLDKIDKKFTYAPVAAIPVFRALVALAAVEKLYIYHIDVDNAFLNSSIGEDEVYIHQPIGFKDNRRPNSVCKLNKAIYGLRQAANKWFETIDNVFREINFNPISVCKGVYVKRKGNDNVYILLYVDDILVFVKTQDQYYQVKEELKEKFQIKELGLAKQFLNIEINQYQHFHKMSLSQPTYILDILNRYGYGQANTRTTPLPPRLKIRQKLNEEDELRQASAEEIRNYQSQIGALMYVATATRPDIAFAVNILARYASNPQEHHVTYIGHIYRYLRGTVYKPLILNSKALSLIVYSDSDFGNNQQDSRSQTGTLVLLDRSPIHWISKKQSCVTDSTTFAEYIALAHATKEIRFFKCLFNQLGYALNKPILLGDNNASLAIAEGTAEERLSKHIYPKFHLTREAIKNKEIELRRIASKFNLADTLTKAVDKQRLDALIQCSSGNTPNYRYN